jgi:hypothetical protein
MVGSAGFTGCGRHHSESSGRAWKRCLAAAGALAVLLACIASNAPAAADGETAGAEVLPVALAFQTAVSTHDAGALLKLLHAGAVVKERNAVLAAGSTRLAAWIGECLATDFVLKPGTLAIKADPGAVVLTTDPRTLIPTDDSITSAAWEFADSTGCYWRMRPGADTAPWPGPEVNPAEGRVTITVGQGRITSLTLVYSDAWQARYLRSVAAPIVAAQARATATAAAAQQIAAAATAEVARTAARSAPPAPDTQGRTVPSVWPWLGALGLLGLVGIMAAAGSQPH